MKRLLSAGLLLAVSTVAPSLAMTTIYDFEPAWQFEDVFLSQLGKQSVTPSQKFVVGGKQSARFAAEATPVAPVFTIPNWENDWERFDRLAMDLTNPTDREIRLQLFVGNESNGYGTELVLPPLSHRRQIVELKFPEHIRKNNILRITFTGPANQAFAFYGDNFALLLPEDPPQKSKAKKKDAIDDPALMYANQTQTTGTPPHLLKEIEAYRVQMAKDKLAAVRKHVDDLSIGLPGAEAWLKSQADSLEGRIAEAQRDAWRQTGLIDDINRLWMSADRFKQIAAYKQQYKGDTAAGFLVAFADPMQKVMPKQVTNDLTVATHYDLKLARAEKESLQIAVVPFEKDARHVTVTASDLTGPDGAKIDADQVNVELMGYVETKMRTEPGVDYTGWWPDPLIRTRDAIDVKLGDIQTWWVRVRAAKDQQPGNYAGTLTVSAEGQKPQTFDLNVQVYDFSLPPHAPIPTAITYMSKGWYTSIPAIATKEKWDKVKFAHADFLADYLINMDDIYRGNGQGRPNSVDWEIIKYLHDKNELVAFNIGGFHSASDKAMAEFKPNYEKARELGVLDHAYTYGYDERPASEYQRIENASKRIREIYPELLIMTTAQDHSYGSDSVVKSLTAWCPIISRYNPEMAEQARKEGKTVWWYTCIWPPHPYPNIFVDYPAIDNRILMGWMTARYQPDGYLYYHTTINRNPNGLTKWPYTDWNPNSYGQTNGDGSYFCFDAQGVPIGTIRVENYRDGLEDLAYYMILEHKLKLAKRAGADAGWIESAESALHDVNRYIRSRTDWTSNPQDVYAYRDRIAKLIESSPIKDDNPWKNGLPARGLPRDE